MRIYKAYLDDNFNVISYCPPTKNETIFCRQGQYSFNVDLPILEEYIELNGYATFYKSAESMTDFIMYIDVDYRFHTIWDNDTSIYVLDQLKLKMREESASNGILDSNKGYIHLLPKIEGTHDLYVGDKVHLHYKYNGMWDSSNDKIASIDKYTGLVTARSAGECVINHIFDSGFGITKSYHKLIIKCREA